MASMEAMLMGGDSSSDSDGDEPNKTSATISSQVTASTAAAASTSASTLATTTTTTIKPPTIANIPTNVVAAALPPSTPKQQQQQQQPVGGSELTNRLKNLYGTSPPLSKGGGGGGGAQLAASGGVKVGLVLPQPPNTNNPMVKPTGVGVGAPTSALQQQQQQQQQQRRPPPMGAPLPVRTSVATSKINAQGAAIATTGGGPTGVGVSRPPPMGAPPPVSTTNNTTTNPSSQSQSSSSNNNNNYVPPMVHTNHHGSNNQSQQLPGQQQRQVVQQPQQQQRPGGGPGVVTSAPGQQQPPPGTVGRIPAPLPKARTAMRSAPPSNRVASVPSAPVPPSPMTTTQQQQQQQQQQQSSSRQYSHAPHLKRGSTSSVQQQQQQSPRMGQPMQPQQHGSSSSRGGIPSVVSSAGGSTSTAGGNLTDQEKKEKERFLMFTRVLMKYLEQRDVTMHAKAKAQIKECYEKNKRGDPAFKSLTTSMKARLRATVGEVYWRKAHDYLEHFLKQKQNSGSRASAQQRAQQLQQQQQRGGHPSQVGGSSQQQPPPIVRTSAPGQPRPGMAGVQSQAQQQILTQQQAAAAKKMPLGSSNSARSGGIPSTVQTTGSTTVPPAALPLTAEQVKKQKDAEEAEKRRQRNEQAKKRRAIKKKQKEEQAAAEAKKKATHTSQLVSAAAASKLATANLPSSVPAPAMGSAIPTTSASGALTSQSSVLSSASSKSKDSSKSKTDAAKKKKKKVTTTTSSSGKASTSSALLKRKNSLTQSNKLMDNIDHAVLIDVKSLPNLLSKEYKTDVNLDEEQRILLYGDEKRQAKVKDIAKAAAAALDNNVESTSKEASMPPGVPPLPSSIPAMLEGWGTKNVVAVRTAWAKIRLPESEAIRVEMEQKQETASAANGEPKLTAMRDHLSSSGLTAPTSSSTQTQEGLAAELKIEDDTTNHVWCNESRAEQDPTLAMLSEATEQFLKSAIEKAIGKARLRQNLDGVRLWHTLHAQSVNNASTTNGNSSTGKKPPAALLRLGCDVRRQIALAEGNAAKTYQRMEDAITRQNDTYHSDPSAQDPDKMLMEATSMADLSRKPPLKSASQVADLDAKRKFAVFGGCDSMEPPLGRVPKKAKVTLQDIELGDLGNRTSMIRARRKRFRVGLRY